MDPVVAIVGPTGVGKTAVALEWAEREGGEIVNLDSRQVYRGLDIGSAKPTAEERERVPHHVFDVVDPDQDFDCVQYRQRALAAIEEIRARGRIALLVGGTGLYLKVLRYGLFEGPGRDPALRAELRAAEEAEPGVLHRYLAEVDPEAARRLHPNDRIRLIRALEVYRLSGRPLSAWQAEHGFRTRPLDVRIVGLWVERRTLYERLNRRCDEMIRAGLLEEVRALDARGYGPDLSSMRTIGYREISAYLRGELSLEQARDAMARATRRLAKRQLTWFRGIPDLWWQPAPVNAW